MQTSDSPVMVLNGMLKGVKQLNGPELSGNVMLMEVDAMSFFCNRVCYTTGK